MKRLFAIATMTLLIVVTTADARRHSHRDRGAVADANGNVVSHKTGARATVGAAYAARFQGYIDELESGGATIYFMGGMRRGKCRSGSMHPCGKAIDVCQLARGKVSAKCNLPGRANIAAVAARHGLFEGGQWCHSDYGHAQVGVSASACGERTFMAKRRHHRRGEQTTRVAAAPDAAFYSGPGSMNFR